MKKRLLVFLLLLLGMVVFTACQESEDHNKHETNSQDDEVLAPRVEIVVAEKAEKNQDVPIAAKVYYGEELVDDAEVRFEIKRNDESEEIDAKLAETGTYEITYQFKEDGIYTIIAHTDVRKIHTMPSTDIQIGEIDEAMKKEHEDAQTNNGTHHDHE
ncbi:FixH family protein [Metabacillus malikii]|uniref:YtkA-like domain-containing protein n=1 Tax=Metabacillus malikii TaxID=1504265 RepID=A0ABT9ZH61_9BACI|nr:FixH family protein [Metabacillus malikii]MDQ0231141.1 hypothetical protein [Metabacillus malikii]